MLHEVLEIFMSLVEQGAIQIAFGLFIVGEIIKKTNKIPNSLIPLLLLVVGVAFSLAMGTEASTVEKIIQGIYATGMAVLGDQMLKQGAEFHELMLEE